MSSEWSRKRSHPTASPSEGQNKSSRRDIAQRSPRRAGVAQDQEQSLRRHRARDFDDQFRTNQVQEDAQMRAWVAKEDDFVLKQSKKKARIRVKDGRANPVDWLAMTLSEIHHDRDPLEEDEDEAEMNVINPSGLIETLDLSELRHLEKDIDVYLTLEKSQENNQYWNSLKIICQHRLSELAPSTQRTNSTVSTEINKILSPKTLDQLAALENQVAAKLRSNEPIDVEYWEKLLENVKVFQAKAKLKSMHESAIAKRLDAYQDTQREEAIRLQSRMRSTLGNERTILSPASDAQALEVEPELSIRIEDKSSTLEDEKAFIDRFCAKNTEKARIQNLGYIPPGKGYPAKDASTTNTERNGTNSSAARTSGLVKADTSKNSNFDREAARGFGEDEEIFTGEEEVNTQSDPPWAGKYRPRKPRYFNRVQMGYEWNKYNQTHYDHDNPPPKVVQGYKFNIFYPDLIDKVKAPTYRIEREGGRRRGQSFAPAGEEDTCLIRFVSGPPYEDIAFRIVDKEWDFSAKRERGFRSSFDKGVLQLHFQLRKIYYRK